MRKIFNTLLKFKFKVILSVGIITILAILDSIFDTNIFSGPMAIIFSGLILFVFLAFWSGVINLWKVDNDIPASIMSGVIGTAFFGVVTYILLTNL